MDEILTRWATDMSRYAKEFKDHAETIARWDQLIVDNSSKIDKLYVRTRTAERQTVSVDMQLTTVENSQSELESWLTKYENDVDEMLAKDSTTPSELGGPDQERERTYKLAEKLEEKLNEMDKDLSSMVEEVNAANASLSRNGQGDEPVSRSVAEILLLPTNPRHARSRRLSRSSTLTWCSSRLLTKAPRRCKRRLPQHEKQPVRWAT
jgi:nuclear pore complex protein Nup62